MIHKAAALIFETGDVTVALYRLAPGEGVPVHKHEHAHDLLMLKGRIRIDLGALTPMAEEGGKIVFQSGVQHGFEAIEMSEVICIHKTAALNG